MSDDSPTEDQNPDRSFEFFSEPETEERILPKIGPWQVLRKLGAGGMGTVYLCRHDETDQEAAVKVLAASLAREEGTVQRFLREIETMSKLRGRHIVSFFDSGEDEELEQLYFAMEYVPGETLADRLRREKRLPWDQVVDIALQICTALKSAHAAGIIHRDLKPSNLLIGEDGIIKLTDFGVAQVFASQRLTVTGGVIGTAEYMSPEQADGRRAHKKSDLYSLGAVMYVMLTGRPPFTGKTSLDIIRKLTTARFDRPSLYVPEMPRLLEDIITTLLEKKPDDRYGDAHIVALRLAEVIRRVELAEEAEAQQDSTSYRLEESTTSGTVSHEAETRAAGTRGPSPATMMRDVFRAEVERQAARGPLASLFDKTWVLVGSLILVVAAAIAWFEFGGMDRDSSPDTPAELSSEVERFWFLAKARRRERDYAAEERLLVALRDVIGEAEEHSRMHKQIDERLIELRQDRREQVEGYELARDALSRAEALIEQDQWDEASRILRGIVELYGNDPGAGLLIEKAAKLSARIEAEWPGRADE